MIVQFKMKLVIFALTMLAAICTAQVPEALIILPELNIPDAWDHHNALKNMQDEITLKVQGGITAVAAVLDKSAEETLRQHEDVIYKRVKLFAPSIEQLKTLRASDCILLNSITTLTNYDIRDCAASYTKRVMAEVKSSVGQNAIVEPEAILSLEATIAALNIELGNCHEQIYNDFLQKSALFSRMVQTCANFHNAKEPSGPRTRLGRTSTTHFQILEKFHIEFAKLKPYEWQS